VRRDTACDLSDSVRRAPCAVPTYMGGAVCEFGDSLTRCAICKAAHDIVRVTLHFRVFNWHFSRWRSSVCDARRVLRRDFWTESDGIVSRSRGPESKSVCVLSTWRVWHGFQEGSQRRTAAGDLILSTLETVWENS